MVRTWLQPVAMEGSRRPADFGQSGNVVMAAKSVWGVCPARSDGDGLLHGPAGSSGGRADGRR